MEKGSIKINIEEGRKPSVEAELVNGTCWLSKYEIARLLNCFVQKVDANLRSIFNQRLLWEDDVSYCNRYIHKGQERQTVYYNMEALIFISYRVNTLEAKVFRQFVNSALRESLNKNSRDGCLKLSWIFCPEQDKYWLN